MLALAVAYHLYTFESLLQYIRNIGWNFWVAPTQSTAPSMIPECALTKYDYKSARQTAANKRLNLNDTVTAEKEKNGEFLFYKWLFRGRIPFGRVFFVCLDVIRCREVQMVSVEYGMRCGQRLRLTSGQVHMHDKNTTTYLEHSFQLAQMKSLDITTNEICIR